MVTGNTPAVIKSTQKIGLSGAPIKTQLNKKKACPRLNNLLIQYNQAADTQAGMNPTRT